DAAAKIIADFFRVSARCQLARKTLSVDADPRGVHRKVVVLEGILVVVEHVVHLPKPSLRCGRLRRLGSVLGVRVRLAERKIAENEAEPLAHIAAQVLNDGMRTPAMRTLEIAILDERHRSLARAE